MATMLPGMRMVIPSVVRMVNEDILSQPMSAVYEHCKSPDGHRYLTQYYSDHDTHTVPNEWDRWWDDYALCGYCDGNHKRWEPGLESEECDPCNKLWLMKELAQ